MNVPMINFSVDHMRQEMRHAFTSYQVQMDTAFKNALDAACSEENIQRVISDAMNEELQAAIGESVKAFFRYGAGREVIDEEVKRMIGERCSRKTP